MSSSGIEVTGFDQLAKAFGKLDDRVKKNVLRKSARFAMTPVKKTAKELVQNRTGFTRDNIATRAKIYNDGQTVVVVVGIRHKAKTTVNGKNHAPAKIEHILSEGFTHKSGTRVEGSEFARRSLEQNESKVKQRIITKLGREIHKEAAKARAG